MKNKRTFKVEIRTTCKVCGGPISGKRYRSYCSAKCRNRFFNKKYSAYRSILQRERYDRAHDKYKPGRIQCQVCGRWYVQVCSHAYERHGLLGREYKKLFGYDLKKGKIPGWYREKKSELNRATWDVIGGNLKKGEAFWFKPGDKKAGRYERSYETLERLKNLHKFNRNYAKSSV